MRTITLTDEMFEAFKAIFTEPDEKTYENMTLEELHDVAFDLQTKAIAESKLGELGKSNEYWDEYNKVCLEFNRR